MAIPKEPKRQTDVQLLKEPFRSRFLLFFKHINDLVKMSVFETSRTLDRQKRLYDYGRKFAIGQKPKTRTMNSEHIKGNAVDIVFGQGKTITWAGDRVKVHRIAKMYGIEPLNIEQCHLQGIQASTYGILTDNGIQWNLTKDVRLRDQLHKANNAIRSK